MFSLDGSSKSTKFTFFSKYVTRAIPNILTQSRFMHSGSYPKFSSPAQLRDIVKFQKILKKRKIAN